jgi:hypothetical protein
MQDVRGRGWTAARELRVGDALRSHDGRWQAVEGVRDTGREEVVYNGRVAEYHTYFVGDEGWGFSVWAHNSCGPTGSPVRVTGQIGYGSSDLSRAAQAYRRTEGVTDGRNVAVFEYRAADGSLQTIARVSERRVGHAERIIARELETMGVQPSQVTRIYSELQPCVIPTEAAGCARFIRNTFPQAEVTWSFEYGATEASRRAGVAALRQAVENLGR